MNGHSFAMRGEQIYFDNQQVNHEELWYAIAGKGAVPTVEEAGRLLAESLARWKVIEGLQELLQQNMTAPYLPQARLDPFIEAALARCEDTPTREKVAALAQVIDQPIDVVVELLRARGKVVTSAAKEDEEKVAEQPPAEPPVQVEKGSRSKQFWWSGEMISQLKTAFLASPEKTTKAAARSIAEKYGWPEGKVSYKIYELDLPRKKAEIAEKDKAAPKSQEVDQAEFAEDATMEDLEDSLPLPANKKREVEIVSAPLSLAPSAHANNARRQKTKANGKKQAPVSSLERGNVMWEVLLAGEQQAQYWSLDYAYGSFPLKGGTIVSYGEQKYLLRVVGVNMLKVAAVGERVLAVAV